MLASGTLVGRIKVGCLVGRLLRLELSLAVEKWRLKTRLRCVDVWRRIRLLSGRPATQRSRLRLLDVMHGSNVLVGLVGAMLHEFPSVSNSSCKDVIDRSQKEQKERVETIREIKERPGRTARMEEDKQLKGQAWSTAYMSGIGDPGERGIQDRGGLSRLDASAPPPRFTVDLDRGDSSRWSLRYCPMSPKVKRTVALSQNANTPVD